VKEQEGLGTGGLVARGWEVGGESLGKLLRAPFLVLCSYAAAVLAAGTQPTSVQNAAPGALGHTPHLCWHGWFAKLHSVMAPVL